MSAKPPGRRARGEFAKPSDRFGPTAEFKLKDRLLPSRFVGFDIPALAPARLLAALGPAGLRPLVAAPGHQYIGALGATAERR
jgi:hypothetical protein